MMTAAGFEEHVRRVLGTQYEIQRELGRGGMARVYLAHDRALDRQVAIKVLAPESAAEAEAVPRFLQEVHTAAQLNHPHIVPLHAAGERDGIVYLVMTCIEGTTLRERLRGGKLPVEYGMRVLLQLLDALAFAHRHGVIHRDIKPENVLLDAETGHARVTDFGVARVAAPDVRLTRTGAAIGTPLYMSPEQITAGQVDARSDIYAAGLVAYEMLAGEPPFSAKTAEQVLASHLTTKPTPINQKRPRIPAALARAVMRSLEKDPADRWQTAEEFADAVRATTVQADSQSRRWPRMAAVAAVAAAIAVVAMLLWARRDEGTTGPGRLVPLTTYPGLEAHPSWSPDGASVAFVSEQSGNPDIWVRHIVTGQTIQVTNDPAEDTHPAWSPDGNHIAFVSSRGISARLDQSEILGYTLGGAIWVAPALGGAPRRIVADGYNPSWSPDGHHLVFDSPRSGQRRIWATDVASGALRQITRDSIGTSIHLRPRWSPDGRWIAYQAQQGVQLDIHVVSAAGDVTNAVTRDAALDQMPAWSADSRALYFTSSRSGPSNIWRARLDRSGRAAGDLEQVTTGAGEDLFPAVARDGRVAFSVRTFGAQDIYAMPINPSTARATGPPRPIVTSHRDEEWPVASPDGRTIAFSSDQSGDKDIWVAGADGRNTRQLTSGPGNDLQPSWSSDGSRIAFFSNRDGDAEIYVVSSGGGPVLRLTRHPANDQNPFWSPDDREIAFMSDRSGRAEVWVMSSGGGEPVQVTKIGAIAHDARWSPDGRWILFTSTHDGDRNEWAVPRLANGGFGEPRRLTLESTQEAHGLWSPDGRIVMYLSDHKTVRALPFAGGAPWEIYSPPGNTRVDDLFWTRDGKMLYFTHAQPEADIWLMEPRR